MRPRWGLALLAIVATAFPVPAGADENLGTDGGFTYIRDLSSAGVLAGTVKAACPPNTHVVGGGGENGLSGLYPTDDGDPGTKPDDGFAVRYSSVSNYTKAYAICKGGAAPAYAVQESTLGVQRLQGVACPAGTHVSSGGVRIEGPPSESFINSSYPIDLEDGNTKPDDGWRVRVVNRGTDEKAIQVYAICREELPRYRTGGNLTIPSGQGIGTQTGCTDFGAGPTIGGGIAISGANAAEAYIFETAPRDIEEPPSRAWVATAYNTQGQAKTFTPHAICDL